MRFSMRPSGPWALTSDHPSGWAFLVALCHFLLLSHLYKSGPIFYKAVFLYFSSSYYLSLCSYMDLTTTFSMYTDSAFCFISIYWPWRSKQYINPKHQWTSTSLHDVTFQKITLQSHCCENLKSNSHRKWLKVNVRIIQREENIKDPACQLRLWTLDVYFRFVFIIYTYKIIQFMGNKIWNASVNYSKCELQLLQTSGSYCGSC
jgi:hypothetical protein